MFCSKCGFQSSQGEIFCKQCGSRLESTQSQLTQDDSKIANTNEIFVDSTPNPSMKKCAILSIILPAVSIIWYWYIGLSVYIAIFLAVSGFSFAEKGQVSNKKLATIGKVLNGVLFGLALVMLVFHLIESI